MNLFQILSDSTNNQLENSQISSRTGNVDNESISVNHLRRRRRRGHHPLTLDTIRRYKNEIKRRNSLQDNDRITIDIELLKDIESFQQGKIQEKQVKLQQAKLQRSLYNAKQTPLIPFILDKDFPFLFESSSLPQNDLLFNILTVLNSVDEERTFFEQFRI